MRFMLGGREDGGYGEDTTELAIVNHGTCKALFDEICSTTMEVS